MLDIDGVHIIVLVEILAEELALLDLLDLRAMGSEAFGDSLSVDCVALVAVRGENLGEEAADDGAEEGETGADDGDVAFCCCPVGCADIAVYNSN